jgi:hypothetical protein
LLLLERVCCQVKSKSPLRYNKVTIWKQQYLKFHFKRILMKLCIWLWFGPFSRTIWSFKIIHILSKTVIYFYIRKQLPCIVNCAPHLILIKKKITIQSESHAHMPHVQSPYVPPQHHTPSVCTRVLEPHIYRFTSLIYLLVFIILYKLTKGFLTLKRWDKPFQTQTHLHITIYNKN